MSEGVGIMRDPDRERYERFLLGVARDRRQNVPFWLCEPGVARGGGRARDACEIFREVDRLLYSRRLGATES